MWKNNLQGPISRLTNHYSAFWGQSFVAELTRISAHGEKKLKLRRASLAKSQPQIQPQQPATNTDSMKMEINGTIGTEADGN